MRTNVKIDKLVTIFRAKMGAERITQKELSKRTGIRLEHLNGLLCRRIDLVQADLSKILDELDLNEFWDKLSSPVSTDDL